MYVLDHSKSIPIKIFDLRPPFFEKGLCSQRKITMGKIFENAIFISKYVLDHSESIPFKKKLFLPFSTYDPKFSKMTMSIEESNDVKKSKSRFYFKIRVQPF